MHPVKQFLDACTKGDLDLCIKFCSSCKTHIIKLGFYKASNMGYFNIVKYIYESITLPKFTKEMAFMDACSRGHVDIAAYFHSKGIENYIVINEFYIACSKGTYNTVKWLLSLNGKKILINKQKAINMAKGNKKIISLFT